MADNTALSPEPYPYTSIRDIEIDEIDWLRWQKLVNTVADMFNAPAAFINQANQKGIETLVASEKPETHYSPGGFVPFDCNIYCHHVVRRATSLYVQDASTDPQWQTNPEYIDDQYVSYLGLPIFWPDGNAFGTLCVMDTKTTDYPSQYLDVLAVIRDVINSDLSHFYKENQLLTLSYTDPLTKIYNRRGFCDLVAQNRELARRLNRQLVLIYLDIDDFKPINDDHGHHIGDHVLKNFADSLKNNCRSCDLVGRWGGDEFIVLIYAEDEHKINSFFERLNKALMQLQDTPSFHYSYGLVPIPASCDIELPTLIANADSAMYKNKHKN